MKWISPYMENGNWYRGNLHTHTHVSDGGFSVDYAVIGYQHMAKHDFVVLTDHNYLKKMNPDKAISFELLNEQYKEKKFTIIEGREESFAHHILGIGAKMIYGVDSIGKAEKDYTLEDYQYLIEGIREEGGLVYMAHPHWREFDHWDADTIMKLEGIDGIEIINGNRFSGPGNLATDVWDDVLSRGKKIWGVANDDCHSPATFWVVWNTVCAKSNSKEDILSALKQGSNYFGNGAEFSRIEVQGDKIIVECSDRDVFQTCEKIFRFVGKDGKCLKLQFGKERYAEYKAVGDELYVRVELIMNNGMVAFTNPFYLDHTKTQV